MTNFSVTRGPDVDRQSVQIVIHDQPENAEGSTDRHRALLFVDGQSEAVMKAEIEQVVLDCVNGIEAVVPRGLLGAFTLM